MSNERLLKQAKAKAAKYCAGRERAPYQVMQKLLGWELDEDDAQSILAELTQENYVNEDRFVQAYCHDKFEFNKWGKQRIRQELKLLRIPGDVIIDGLNNIDPYRYEEVLQSLASQKLSSLGSEPDTWKRKQKTIAYLIRKGFEMDLSIETVNQLADRSA